MQFANCAALAPILYITVH